MVGSERMSPDEFIRILGTFDTQDFGPVVKSAKRLLEMDGTSIIKGQRPVPTNELQRIFGRRVSNPYIPADRARLAEQLAQIARRFPDEGWYIHIAVNDKFSISIYANEEGIGRFCVESESQ